MSKGKRYRKETPHTDGTQHPKGRRFASDEDIRERFGVTQDDDEQEPDAYVGKYHENSVVRYQKRKARRQKQNKRDIKISPWLYYAIGVTLVAALGALIFVGFRSCSTEQVGESYTAITRGKGIGDGFPAMVVGNTVNKENFQSVDKEVVALSDTALVRLNSTAKEKLNHQHSYNRAMLAVAGDNMMVYSLGSRGYCIKTVDREIVRSEAENNIITADLTENGQYALVTDAKGYPSQLIVYLSNHNEQYKYSFSNYYVTGIALNEDASRAAVTAISAENGGIVSAVYLFDFTKETPSAVLTYPDVLLTDIEYSANGTVVAVGDTMTSIINGQSGARVDYPYQNRQLSDHSIDGDYTVLALEPYDSTSANQLVLLDKDGNVFASLDTTTKADAVSLKGDTIAVLSGGNVMGYSVNAMRNQNPSQAERGPFSTKPAGVDAKAVALSDESSVYVLGVSEIRYVRL